MQHIFHQDSSIKPQQSGDSHYRMQNFVIGFVKIPQVTGRGWWARGPLDPLASYVPLTSFELSATCRSRERNIRHGTDERTIRQTDDMVQTSCSEGATKK